MTKMNYKEASIKLGGPIALLKLLSTRVAHDISDDACQIFGGRGITKTGMGKFIEGFQRTYKFGAILGGSEEIMADLGIRQAMVFVILLAKFSKCSFVKSNKWDVSTCFLLRFEYRKYAKYLMTSLVGGILRLLFMISLIRCANAINLS